MKKWLIANWKTIGIIGIIILVIFLLWQVDAIGSAVRTIGSAVRSILTDFGTGTDK